jgi:hypothetical protein
VDSLSVVYPQYWLQFDAKECFNNHLDVIMVAFNHPKKLGSSVVWVHEVLSTNSFDIQQFMFKLAMKLDACATMVKPLDVNGPLTCLW